MIANEPDPPAPSSDAARGAPVCNLVARTHRRGAVRPWGRAPMAKQERLRQRVGIGPSIEPGREVARRFARRFAAFACASGRLCASERYAVQSTEKPAVAGLSSQWERLDSNQRRHTPTGLQPVPFSLSGTLPARAARPPVSATARESL